MLLENTFNGQPITDGITAGVEARKQRGLVLAATARIRRANNAWHVPTSTPGKRGYTVRLGEQPSCTCPDHETRGCKCKHIYAVEFVIQREEHPDGSVTVTETLTVQKRKTYPQNWPAYNTAQTTEKAHFRLLLHDLCVGLETPAANTGRPRLPVSDAVFCAVFKVFSTYSSRRFISDLCDAHEKGYISKVPHFNSVLKCLESAWVTPILFNLIDRTAQPLAAVESSFAVDSTGFMVSRFDRWYDQKYGVQREKKSWVKAHICTGVKTNVITAVEIRDQNAADAPLLPALIEKTAERFQLKEVSADKGYLAADNMAAIEKLGATPYIAFKSNSKPDDNGRLWQKMFHFFSFKRDEYLAHYHKRSNVESTVHMVKSKFGDAVRSKTDLAMKNEVLAKIVCHNIACLIQAIHELGIEANFLQPAGIAL